MDHDLDEDVNDEGVSEEEDISSYW